MTKRQEMVGFVDLGAGSLDCDAEATEGSSTHGCRTAGPMESASWVFLYQRTFG